MSGSDYSLNLGINGSDNTGNVFQSVNNMLASLGSQVFTTGVGFNGLATESAASQAALAEAGVTLGETTVAMEAVDVSAGEATVAMDAVSTSALEAATSLDATKAATAEADVGFSGLGPVALLAAAALVGVGMALASSVQKAADFQTQLTSLVTGAGESAGNIKMIGQGILQMSIDTATGTDQLTAGMYKIGSAGFHGAQGLQVLQAASQGARVGSADLKSVANGLTTALTDYHLPASDATSVTNDLITTVASGKTTMQDLSSSLASILPTASAAGVGLSDTTAAMATMTASGTPASQAATYLRQTILALNAPSAGASKALKAVGLSTDQVSSEMKKSLPQALQMITDAVGKKFPAGSAGYIAALKNIVGGSKNLQGMLELTGGNMKTFTADAKNTAGALDKGGGSVQGFSDVQKTLNFQMDKAKQSINAAQIEIGEKLLPVLAKILTAINPLITGFTKWIGTLHANSPVIAILGGVLAALAVVVAVAVVPAMLAAAGGLLAVTVAGAPLWIILLAIIAVVTAIILVFQHWGAIMDWVSGKAEQMRIKNEEAHVKMRISADTNTAQQATKVIANIDKERAGVLQKLKDTHDPAERMELQHQLNMLTIQKQKQEQRLALAEKDRAKQVAKQQQLHADMIEAQKNFFQRFLDMCGSWIGDQMSKLGSMVHGWVNWMGNLKDEAIAKLEELVGDSIQKVLDLKNEALEHIQALKNEFIVYFEYLRLMITLKIQQAKTNFLNEVQTLKDNAIQKVRDLVSGIEGFFTSLPGKALQWGRDLIQNLINGIESMLGNLAGMAGKAANTIASVLHFTKPDTGPLVTVDEWMPHLGDTLIEGLNNITPSLQAAAIKAAAAVAGPLSGQAGSVAPGHIFDFIGSNYSGYASGMAETKKRNAADAKKKADEKASLEKLEATLEKHIKALEEPAKAPKLKTAKERAAYAKEEAAKEATLAKEEAHIQKLEQQYHITVNHTGKGKWTKQDAKELADLIAAQQRLQSKHPQAASGRRN